MIKDILGYIQKLFELLPKTALVYISSILLIVVVYLLSIDKTPNKSYDDEIKKINSEIVKLKIDKSNSNRNFVELVKTDNRIETESKNRDLELKDDLKKYILISNKGLKNDLIIEVLGLNKNIEKPVETATVSNIAVEEKVEEAVEDGVAVKGDVIIEVDTESGKEEIVQENIQYIEKDTIKNEEKTSFFKKLFRKDE